MTLNAILQGRVVFITSIIWGSQRLF